MTGGNLNNSFYYFQNMLLYTCKAYVKNYPTRIVHLFTIN